MDVYRRSSLIASALRNRLVPTVNDMIPLCLQARNAARYVALVVTVVFPSLPRARDQANYRMNERTTEVESLIKKTEDA